MVEELYVAGWLQHRLYTGEQHVVSLSREAKARLKCLDFTQQAVDLLNNTEFKKLIH